MESNLFKYSVKAITSTEINSIYTKLKNSLSGNWTSKAWDGVLNESWSIDQDGHLIQNAQYIENEMVLYEANQ